MKKTYAWSIGIAVAILGWLGSGLYFTEGKSIEPSIADQRLREAEVAADRIPTNVKIKSSVAKEITRYSTTSGKTQNKRTVVTRTETTGKIVYDSSLLKFKEKGTTEELPRYNRQRAVTISAALSEDYTLTVSYTHLTLPPKRIV